MTNQPWAKLGETELPLASKGVTSKGWMPGRSLALFIERKPHPWLGSRGAVVQILVDSSLLITSRKDHKKKHMELWQIR